MRQLLRNRTPRRRPLASRKAPVWQNQPKARHDKSDPESKPRDTMKMSLHVLNLEDDANDAGLNEAMLSARWPDCRFVRVDNCADFLAALEQSDLDLILADCTIPGFNGLDAPALAREK